MGGVCKCGGGKILAPPIRAEEHKAGAGRRGKGVFLQPATVLITHWLLGGTRCMAHFHLCVPSYGLTAVLLCGCCQICQLRATCVPAGCRQPEERLNAVPALLLPTEHTWEPSEVLFCHTVSTTIVLFLRGGTILAIHSLLCSHSNN